MGEARVAVAVVVDARNVHGFLGRLLDQPVVPGVDAVVDSLAGYGLRPVSVSVGVALAQGRSGSEALQRRSERNRAYAEAIDAHPIGRAVRGVLAPSGSKVFEKDIDVRLAVEVCRLAHDIAAGRSEAAAVVLLGQDTDLDPALSYARSLGVPAFVAGGDVHPKGHSDTLLLGQAALWSLAGRPNRLVGHELRAYVGAYARTPRCTDWRVVDPADAKHHDERGHPMVKVESMDRSGVPGAAPPGSGGDRAVLTGWWTAGVHVDGHDGFPYVSIANRRVARAGGSVFRCEVFERVNALYAKVRNPVGPGALDVRIPPGGPVRGEEVYLVERRRPGMGSQLLYLGPVAEPRQDDAWWAVPALARAERSASPTQSWATTNDGRAIQVHHSDKRPLLPGRRYALWETEPGRAVPMSTALPEPAGSG